MQKSVIAMLAGVSAVVVLVLVLGLQWTSVDATEWCVLTRFGKVKQERLAPGMNWTPFADATCFSLTEMNYPLDEEPETMEAQTADPITVIGDVALVFTFNQDAVYETFLDKRSSESALVEVRNAIREGYRTALAGWSVEDIFSERRAALSDSVQAHIQRKLGTLAVIQRVFVRDIQIPRAIENARIAAAAQAQELARVRQQFTIDSVNSMAIIITAQATSEQRRLEAVAYRSNPELLQLRVAEATAAGLAAVCQGPRIQVCIIGGSVADTWGSLVTRGSQN